MRSDIKTISRKALLTLAALGSILAASTFTRAQGGKTPFTGEWETVAGSATRYSVQLTQTGNKVTGTFTPGNGKIFGGVVVGNKVTFKWTQDGGYSGTGEFTLNADCKGSPDQCQPIPSLATRVTFGVPESAVSVATK